MGIPVKTEEFIPCCWHTIKYFAKIKKLGDA
jgi:hypothetical protein